MGLGRLNGQMRLIGDSWGVGFNPLDLVGHGSFCAGILGAQGWRLPRGVAGRSLILPVRVLAAAQMHPGGPRVGVGALADIDAGMKICVDLGADVINMSFGTAESSLAHGDHLPHLPVIQYAVRYGCTLVAAAGNKGDDERYYPAALPEVIAVGSVDEGGRRSRFSSYGDHLSVCAPGEDIIGLSRHGYRMGSGTSFAAPFVCGVAALLVSRGRRRNVHLSGGASEANPRGECNATRTRQLFARNGPRPGERAGCHSETRFTTRRAGRSCMKHLNKLVGFVSQKLLPTLNPGEEAAAAAALRPLLQDAFNAEPPQERERVQTYIERLEDRSLRGPPPLERWLNEGVGAIAFDQVAASWPWPSPLSPELLRQQIETRLKGLAPDELSQLPAAAIRYRLNRATDTDQSLLHTLLDAEATSKEKIMANTKYPWDLDSRGLPQGWLANSQKAWLTGVNNELSSNLGLDVTVPANETVVAAIIGMLLVDEVFDTSATGFSATIVKEWQESLIKTTDSHHFLLSPTLQETAWACRAIIALLTRRSQVGLLPGPPLHKCLSRALRQDSAPAF
jgi:subtilisin family serine protease